MTNYARMYRLGMTPWERYGSASAASISAVLDRECNDRRRPLGRALDLGCGRGQFTPELARRGWKAVGVDYVPAAVEVAQSRGAEGVTYLVGDVTNLAAADLGRFEFFLDMGCFQGLDTGQRRAAGATVSALAHEPDRTTVVPATPLSTGRARRRRLCTGRRRHSAAGRGRARQRKAGATSCMNRSQVSFARASEPSEVRDDELVGARLLVPGDDAATSAGVPTITGLPGPACRLSSSHSLSVDRNSSAWVETWISAGSRPTCSQCARSTESLCASNVGRGPGIPVIGVPGGDAQRAPLTTAADRAAASGPEPGRAGSARPGAGSTDLRRWSGAGRAGSARSASASSNRSIRSRTVPSAMP